jgi:phosphoadenosine phosphosulfate reductase
MTESTAIRIAVSALDRLLENASPVEVIREATRTVPDGRLAVVSSFGIESAPLLKLVADVDPTLPVLFIDTGFLFGETLAYRDTLVTRFGLTDVRLITPRPSALMEQDPKRDLWLSDLDACCRLRKIEPLGEALQSFDAWINGRKRYHGFERTRLASVEHDGNRFKFNPFAHVSRQELEDMFEAFDLPRHPLEVLGFSSVGCMPCTSRTSSDEDARAGRWRGLRKTECGIHVTDRRIVMSRENPAVRFAAPGSHGCG